mgnify:CR=1 FL=1
MRPVQPNTGATMGSSFFNTDPFTDLTWGDLTFWAGKTVVADGRMLQKNGAVTNLSRTGEDHLIAWVMDEEMFATLVGFEDGELFCRCGCHHDEVACEHAVALILELIAYLRNKVPVPSVAANDERFFLL